MVKRHGLLRIALTNAALLILIASLLLPSRFGMATTSQTKQMNLSLTRISHSKTGTFGVLSINGVNPVYTLEETELQIAPGTYPVELTFSPRFHRLLPLLIVPHRSAIRIHAGNWPRDSEGCILVGLGKGNTMLYRSLEALDPLVIQIQQAIDAGDVVQLSISGS